MKTIAVVLGARPQFIKHAPVSPHLRKYFNELIIHTGQHYEKRMSEVFFKELKLPTPILLRRGIKFSTPSKQCEGMIDMLKKTFSKHKPDAVLVYGDTTSTLAGAITARICNLPLIHVEAGLRSFNYTMPEEFNRVITDHCSQLVFAPTKDAVKNLKKEKCLAIIKTCGDVMFDAFLMAKKFNSSRKLTINKFYFLTLHRNYNVDKLSYLKKILYAVNKLDKNVIFSIHPRTKKMLKSAGIPYRNYENIQFLKPLSYFDTHLYLQHAECILTDSGGMQKEAYWHKKKCITLRTETEWTDTLKGGWNHLCGNHFNEISKLIGIKPNERRYNKNLFGKSGSSKRIVGEIRRMLRL